MAFINVPQILATGYNFTPLPRTWYEFETENPPLQTIRFAKRTDHTGVLIQFNRQDVIEENS